MLNFPGSGLCLSLLDRLASAGPIDGVESARRRPCVDLLPLLQGTISAVGFDLPGIFPLMATACVAVFQ